MSDIIIILFLLSILLSLFKLILSFKIDCVKLITIYKIK